MYIPIIIAILFAIYITNSVLIERKHSHLVLEEFEHRIHVNGIRGKSTVTRLIAASLREGGINTLGKTTGSAARLVIGHRKDIEIPRTEADIAEQKQIIDTYKGQGYRAIVFECMAINPIYQKYLEEKIMHSTIGVITNIREDHMDMLGQTLPEIARNLCATIPKNGHLITAETNPKLLTILRKECKRRNTKFHAVGSMRIGDKQMSMFGHFEYKSNVAIAIKVAQLTGIKRNTALNGMHKAQPDPGAFALKKIIKHKKTIHWANLFAINDSESFIMTSKALRTKVGDKTTRAIILNNRHDRPDRVSQFANIAVRSIGADYIFAFGDYEKNVIKEVAKLTRKRKNKNVVVVSMGNESMHSELAGTKLLKVISKAIVEDEFLLLGSVNIHTKQSQALLKFLEKNHAH